MPAAIPWTDIGREVVYLLHTFIAVFVIVDPFAMVPVYLSLTARYTPHEVDMVRRRASYIACSILLLFAVSGLSIFRVFGITLPAFQIAGGILLLLLGISQLNNTRMRVQPEETTEGMERDDISVFPLGTPLLAGPGAISTVVLLSSQTRGVLRVAELLIAVAAAMLASYFVLRSAHLLLKVLGRTGLNLFTRLMGLILTAISIQFMINGVTGLLHSLGVMAV